jgi:hypothetical protein
MARLQSTMPHSFAQQQGNMKFGGKEPIEIEDDIKFTFELRLLNNVKGIYINPENCAALTAETPLVLDDMEVEKKSQMYWLRFQDCRN